MAKFAQLHLFDDVPEGAAITDIVAVKDDPALRRIRVNGRSVATVRATDVETLGLQEGMAFTRQRRAALAEIVAINRARRIALNLLGRRAYTSAELIERITRRGYDEVIAERVTRQLAADHWIDDAQFARDLVDELLAKKPAGRPLLEQKLAARKVPDELASRAIDDALAEHDEHAAALEFARRLLGRRSSKSAAAAARSIHGKLARRGVDESIIQDVLEELDLLANDEHGGYD